MGEPIPGFRQHLEQAGLGPFAQQLERLARPGIRLRSHPMGEKALGPGWSRLGGRPYLPALTERPSYEGRSQSFIAQVNLAEIHPFDTDAVLSDAGLLSLFYDSEQSIWGFDPRQKLGWTVLYTSAGTDLVTREFPDALPAHGRFEAMELRPEVDWTCAPWELSEVGSLGLSRDERLAYVELLPDGGGVIHRLLGHPDPVQGDMQLECQLVSHGLYCRDASGYNDPRAAVLEPGAVDWRLLLQIDSEDEAGMMWGDVGRIYYWMDKDAIWRREWDQAPMVLQCG